MLSQKTSALVKQVRSLEKLYVLVANELVAGKKATFVTFASLLFESERPKPNCNFRILPPPFCFKLNSRGSSSIVLLRNVLHDVSKNDMLCTTTCLNLPLKLLDLYRLIPFDLTKPTFAYQLFLILNVHKGQLVT